MITVADRRWVAAANRHIWQNYRCNQAEEAAAYLHFGIEVDKSPFVARRLCGPGQWYLLEERPKKTRKRRR